MFISKLHNVVVVLLLVSVSVGCLTLVAPADRPAPAGPTAAEEGTKEGKPAEEKAALLPVRRDAQGDPLPPGALARLGTLRFKHGNAVQAVVYKPIWRTASAGR
jgi:hypothetical protein